MDTVVALIKTMNPRQMSPPCMFFSHSRTNLGSFHVHSLASHTLTKPIFETNSSHGLRMKHLQVIDTLRNGLFFHVLHECKFTALVCAAIADSLVP